LNKRIVNPRRHLVNFRVTEEEHRRIREACLARGSRGVSEFARWSVLASAQILELAHPTAEPIVPPPNFGWLDDQIASFDRSLERLVQALDTLTARVPTFEKE
jgi:hypothetical protein